jgi:hypothetical protein
MKYQNMIGDGKHPNYYWVFHYDEKLKKVNGEIDYDNLLADDNPAGGLLGRFKTYREAIQCVNEKAYYPHVFIEDRLTGQVFEQICIVCTCCDKEEYRTYEDIKFTKDTIEKTGKEFK